MRPGVVIARAVCLPAFLLSAVFIGTQCNNRKTEVPKNDPAPLGQEHKIEIKGHDQTEIRSKN